MLKSVQEEMLGKIGDSLFSDDDIRLELKDGSAEGLNFNHLLLESISHIAFLFQFHIGVRLTLLVLKGTIEQDDSGVLDNSSHSWVGKILVEHNSVQDTAVFQGSSWDLFDLSVSLNFEVKFIKVSSSHDGSGGLERKISNKTSPSGGELGSNAGAENLVDFLIVIKVNLNSEVLKNLHTILKSSVISLADDRWVNISLNEWSSSQHHLSSKDNN